MYFQVYVPFVFSFLMVWQTISKLLICSIPWIVTQQVLVQCLFDTAIPDHETKHIIKTKLTQKQSGAILCYKAYSKIHLSGALLLLDATSALPSSKMDCFRSSNCPELNLHLKWRLCYDWQLRNETILLGNNLDKWERIEFIYVFSLTNTFISSLEDLSLLCGIVFVPDGGRQLCVIEMMALLLNGKLECLHFWNSVQPFCTQSSWSMGDIDPMLLF